ncbi:predicted flap endonuclease-1-like 5' DNA nuclease [Hoeflea halophila]|uniref:Predicted flap endonuclease-1-like 5' DNA nuclease n=1 Tax=Hoeflea halophila TaxID=714899 RepID=A0A286HKZ4_9HYPH|nr:NADH-ubiquinone dehydrogenase [Hoeflea halophila]SOE08480.1 predicted flap endonuclease-1-like 5' DNA nuclease [Hoeflea halophila]
MSMFSFPTEMNMNEMMKPMNAMADLTRTEGLEVSPLMVYPLGAAAAATAVGFGMAGQMAGMMMGAMQGAMQSQASLLGQHPDLSWMMPVLAEDLAPEEPEAAVEDEKPAGAEQSADIVNLKPAAAKSKVKPASAKAKTSPAKTKAGAPEAKRATEAAVEKLKTDADVAAAASTETSAVANAPAETAKPVLAPEDFRRPAEIEMPEMPDDLKLISGVGPKLEQVLNGLGVWTFTQIAAWKPEEAAWVDDYLQFGGRVERDQWISQAAALAKGGATAD